MSDRPKRKLIEVALPLEAINIASAREKSIRHGHPSTLHLWWARRPLAACRAVLFASLVDDPSSDPDRFPTPRAVEDERARLFGIIERLVLWENSTNAVVLDEARAEIMLSTGGNPPPVLDPFCGGGSIPLEAQRLGLTAYASDLNPVAVLITKALVEIPPKFADMPPVQPDARRGVGGTGAWKGAAGLAEDVRRYGAWMRDEAERRIGNLYPRVRLPTEHGGGEATVIAWIWARTAICPNPVCGARMPLVSSWLLSTRKGHQAWVEPVVDRDARTVRCRVRTDGGAPPAPPKVGRGASFRCLVCGQIAPDEHIKAEGRSRRIGAQLIAVVADGQRGRIYVSPTADQEATARSAQTQWEPDEELADDPRNFWTVNYGLTHFRDLFTTRQLVALATFSDLVLEARNRVLLDARAAGLPDDGVRSEDGGIGAPAYADAVATYLAFAVDRLANRGSTIGVWNTAGEKVEQTFARQALPMSWDFPEANPLGDATGGWSGSLEWIPRVLEALVVGPRAHVTQADATSIPVNSGRIVCTDPPYYDNISYADLSDYFYLWLRRALGGVYPGLLGTVLTPKSNELVASPYRFAGGKEEGERHFETGLAMAFRGMHSSAVSDIPISLFYAFKQSESRASADGGLVVASTGWETMLTGLLDAGLAVVGTWPIHTERDQGLKTGTNVLASSVVLVCRPRMADAGITTRKDLIASLKREMPDALRTLQHGNIAPVDLAQASIGPGMAIFSQYAKVLEPDGSAMPVRTALALINQVLDEILAEQEGEFDADTRWAISWYEQFGLHDAEYGTAETLSRAKNTSVEGLVEAGIVVAARGRVRLLDRAEYSANWDPSRDTRIPVWEATQRLVHMLLTDGESAAADLLARLGGLGDTARDLAYRMYHVAERKGWTEEARAYNALVVAWTDLARGAESARVAQPAQTNLGFE